MFLRFGLLALLGYAALSQNAPGEDDAFYPKEILPQVFPGETELRAPRTRVSKDGTRFHINCQGYMRIVFNRVIHNNLGGMGPDVGKEGIYIEAREIDDEENENTPIVVKISALTPYTPANNKDNGVFNDFGIITQPAGQKVKVEITFEDASSNETRKLAKRLMFSIYDLDTDHSGKSAEYVIAEHFIKAMITNSSTVKEEQIPIGDSGDVETRFHGTTYGAGDNNPKHPDQLTQEQKDKTIVIVYPRGTDRIHLTFGSTTDGAIARGFLFLPDAVLACHQVVDEPHKAVLHPEYAGFAALAVLPLLGLLGLLPKTTTGAPAAFLADNILKIAAPVSVAAHDFSYIPPGASNEGLGWLKWVIISGASLCALFCCWLVYNHCRRKTPAQKRAASLQLVEEQAPPISSSIVSYAPVRTTYEVAEPVYVGTASSYSPPTTQVQVANPVFVGTVQAAPQAQYSYGAPQIVQQQVHSAPQVYYQQHAQQTYAAPLMTRTAVAGIDIDGDGRADLFVRGADLNNDGIPDFLQQGTPVYAVPYTTAAQGQYATAPGQFAGYSARPGY